MDPHRRFRFGVLQRVFTALKLQKRGARVRLPHQAFKVLQLLVENGNQVVTRDELRRALWPVDTFVEFDHGLNNAISRLRELLDDSPTSPRFIETIPRRGYRFIGSIVVLDAPPVRAADRVPAALPPEPAPP